MILRRRTSSAAKIGSPLIKSIVQHQAISGPPSHPHSLTVPTVNAGDMILIDCYCKTDATIPTPTGIGTLTNFVDENHGSQNARQKIFYKIADGSESGATLTSDYTDVQLTGTGHFSTLTCLIISPSTYASVTASSGSGGIFDFPTVVGQRFSLVVNLFTADQGNLPSITGNTNQGPVVSYFANSTAGRRYHVYYTVKRLSSDLTGGQVSASGAANRRMYSILFNR